MQSQVDSVVYRDTDRISIIDPNNPSNDISGGAKNTATVFSCFAKALARLQERMAFLATLPPHKRHTTILECILGGDYSQFREQRVYISQVHEVFFGTLGDPSLHKGRYLPNHGKQSTGPNW